jgi:antitoxin MazE
MLVFIPTAIKDISHPVARIEFDDGCVANRRRTWLQCSHMIGKTKIVRIGNSRGIRVPKVLLDEAQLPEEVELEAEHGRLVVRAARGPRAGWAAAARLMRVGDDDHLLDAHTPTRFEEKDWQWR